MLPGGLLCMLDKESISQGRHLRHRFHPATSRWTGKNSLRTGTQAKWSGYAAQVDNIICQLQQIIDNSRPTYSCMLTHSCVCCRPHESDIRQESESGNPSSLPQRRLETASSVKSPIKVSMSMLLQNMKVPLSFLPCFQR